VPASPRRACVAVRPQRRACVATPASGAPAAPYPQRRACIRRARSAVPAAPSGCVIKSENPQFCHCGHDPQSPDPQFEILNQVQNDGLASFYTACRCLKILAKTVEQFARQLTYNNLFCN
jgi:hypothetical protein